MSNFVLFNIGVSLSDPAWAAVVSSRYWTQTAVCTLHCESIIACGSCAARAALSRRSGGFTWRRAAPAAPGALISYKKPITKKMINEYQKEEQVRSYMIDGEARKYMGATYFEELKSTNRLESVLKDLCTGGFLGNRFI
jgi:hypothetical protein